MKIRINNIGAKETTYIGTPPENHKCRFSISKFDKNKYYGKLNEYLENGWVDCDDYVFKEENTIKGSISKKCFENPEFTYVIAFVDYDEREGCTYLKSVGERILELDKNELKDFHRVYKLVVEEINDFIKISEKEFD